MDVLRHCVSQLPSVSQCFNVFNSYQVHFHQFTAPLFLFSPNRIHASCSARQRHPPLRPTLMLLQELATGALCLQVKMGTSVLRVQHCLQVSEIPVHVCLRRLPVFQLIATHTQLKLGTIRLIVCIKECSIEQA